MRFRYELDDRDALIEKVKLEQELTELRQALTVALSRLEALRVGAAPPRDRSRRSKGGPDLRFEAMAEVEGFIFSLKLKIEQRERRIRELNSKPPH